MKPTLLVVLALLASAWAQNLNPQQALERLFTLRPAKAEWFAPAFLSQVAPAQIDQIIAQLEAQLGKYQAVRPEGQDFVVELEKGLVPTKIALDAQGRIAGLLFQTPRPKVNSLEAALAGFRSLPGRVSVLVLEDGQSKASLNPDEPLAVGSAFKLAVLAALKAEIESGKRKWSDVVELRPEWKSLPSGVLHTWPNGSPLTLHTLAAEMISISDNTAADALISILGREAVEAVASRNRPFLTTKEAFALKNPANKALLERYLKGDATVRAALLPELKNAPLPTEADFTRGPLALQVEWFFSVRELCTLMERVQGLPLMSINPGVANPADWARVAFKGGSEPGVLNLTTGLETPLSPQSGEGKGGKRYCISATWNNPQEALDEQKFITLYSGLLEALRLGP
ncbi:serine hydrolase [Allomeiothermus silvanus]|uniref:serine hydrolase n=1 Tax=Allomeiothermus silvanus TaxID=52022 RepID=UPI0023F201E0|nr:serine hydrolase [Allomeiothermus silvanus]